MNPGATSLVAHQSKVKARYYYQRRFYGRAFAHLLIALKLMPDWKVEFKVAFSTTLSKQKIFPVTSLLAFNCKYKDYILIQGQVPVWCHIGYIQQLEFTHSLPLHIRFACSVKIDWQRTFVSVLTCIKINHQLNDNSWSGAPTWLRPGRTFGYQDNFSLN